MDYIDVQKFDFFGEKKKDFYRKFSVESVLVQGKHRQKAPMVTIVLTTYKRPGLLKQALESALNQVDFEDYQIIVADNEGVDINTETETAKLVSGYQDEKILYYRHVKTIDFKMDYAARLARSKWICFMHDDDILASNHLMAMSGIVREHQKIKFLSCTFKTFYDEISEEAFREMTAPRRGACQIRKYPRAYTCLGYYPGWLGAFIDRKAYISTGGIPTLSTGIGDYCMVGKFMYRYGVYEMKAGVPLYLRRAWSGQATATDTWKRLYAMEYHYHVYMTKKYHKLFRDVWNRLSAYRIISKYENFMKSRNRPREDLEEFAVEAGMGPGALEKGKQYAKDMVWQMVYEGIAEKLSFPVKYNGRI